MRLIARILGVTFFLLLVFSSGTGLFAAKPDNSAEVLAELLEKAPGHRIMADYTFKLMQGTTAINYSGHAVIQENRFHITGNGMDIYCNGVSIVCLDTVRKEAYIEDAVKLEDYIKVNLPSICNLKNNVTISELSDDLSEFDAPELDRNWVVTDLR